LCLHYLLPAIETVKLPAGVLALVLMVNVTGTDTPETGLTELAGWKLHVAPAGSPLHETATAETIRLSVARQKIGVHA
jgi:hypothetical protein